MYIYTYHITHISIIACKKKYQIFTNYFSTKIDRLIIMKHRHFLIICSDIEYHVIMNVLLLMFNGYVHHWNLPSALPFLANEISLALLTKL